MEYSQIISELRKMIPTLTEQQAQKFVCDNLEAALAELLAKSYWDQVARKMIQQKYPNQLKDCEPPLDKFGVFDDSNINWQEVDEAMQRDIQLHEEVRIVYLVDRYQVTYQLEDGQVDYAQAHGATPLLALAELFKKNKPLNVRDR